MCGLRPGQPMGAVLHDIKIRLKYSLKVPYVIMFFFFCNKGSVCYYAEMSYALFVSLLDVQNKA